MGKKGTLQIPNAWVEGHAQKCGQCTCEHQRKSCNESAYENTKEGKNKRGHRMHINCHVGGLRQSNIMWKTDQRKGKEERKSTTRKGATLISPRQRWLRGMDMGMSGHH